MRRPDRASILLALASVLLTYLAFEIVFSALYVYGFVGEPSLWIYETSGKTRVFDPIRGYRLTPTPSRFARITYGVTEYDSTFSGNNEGFADRDDFYAGRRDPKKIRLAVFGDSFTAAEFLETNWPDAVENLSAAIEEPLELLNFSLSGVGLANWWSVLTRLIEPDGYELDGLLFAVFGDDLERGFTISDHRGYRRTMIARMESWNADDWPRSLQEARTYLRSNRGYILSEQQYSDVLEGRWRPDLPRPWRLYVSRRFLSLYRRTARGEDTPSSFLGNSFSDGQLRMIGDLARYAKERSLPILVVHVPSRESLLQGAGVPRPTRRFAELLGATLVDGGMAFDGLSETEIRAHWLPYDGHWAQSGSDRWARFIVPILRENFHRRASAGPRNSRR